jgi:predicted phage-related endonuclease
MSAMNNSFKVQRLNCYVVCFILCLLLLVVIANVKASIETLESEVKGIQQAMKNDTSVSTLDSIKKYNKRFTKFWCTGSNG